MVMPGRKYSYSFTKYRYGFNGKENDNEVNGEGSQQDYGMRIYDPRLGKFLSEDPITAKYPELTPYQFASNRPLNGVDQDGLEYLKLWESNMSMNIQLFEFDGKYSITSDVYLSSYKNVKKATADFLRSGKSCHVIKLGTSNYIDIMEARENAVAVVLRKTPEIEDSPEMPKSLQQKELSLQVPRKMSRIVKKTNPNSAIANVPINGVSPIGFNKRDLIIVLTGYITDIVKASHLSAVNSDFEKANKDLWAMKEVMTDIKIALDNKVFSKEDHNLLYDYADYLLDGTKPMKSLVTAYSATGSEIRNEIIDSQKVQKFDEFSDKIIKIKNK